MPDSNTGTLHRICSGMTATVDENPVEIANDQ
jgi:hypothetical protein